MADSLEGTFEKSIKLKPHLMFLEIEMPAEVGFELLKRYGKIDFKSIFTTSNGHNDMEALRFAALDYLMKPVVDVEMQQVIDRINSSIIPSAISDMSASTMASNFKPHNKKIMLPNSRGLEFLTVSDVVHCQSDNNYTILYTLDGKKKVSTKTLKEYENLLSDYNFMRVHNSHLVNLLHVKEYIKGDGGFATMEDGSQVEISRRKKSEFLAALARL